jgi:hypothetical protein
MRFGRARNMQGNRRTGTHWTVSVEIVAPLLRKAIKPLAAYLVQPSAHHLPVVPTDLDALARVVVPGDVVLVEGNTRFASLVRYLTQSTWSHVAMFVGALAQAPDPPCLVEADIQLGIRALPLSELRGMHARVVRATGLNANERAQVARRVVGRVGQPYDLDCALALGRALWPFGRRDPRAGLTPPPGAHAQGAICSTLLAQAFAESGYPVLPAALAPASSLDTAVVDRVIAPRDFDVSPFFAVVPICGAHRHARPAPASRVATLPSNPRLSGELE